MIRNIAIIFFNDTKCLDLSSFFWISLQKCHFFGFLLLAPRGVAESPRGCEKSILHEILHRFSGPKNFPTFFFHRKKIILKMKKYFFGNIFRKNIFFIEKKSFIFFNEKNIFAEHVPKKIFFHFNIIFFSLKKKVEKKIGSSNPCRIL